MNKLLLNDEEMVITFISLSMLADSAKGKHTGIAKLLKETEAKIFNTIKENPGIFRGLLTMLEREPGFLEYPQGREIMEYLKHIVAALNIRENLMKDKDDPCDLCEGAGVFKNGSGLPCPRCGGTGKLNKKETYN